MHKLQSKGIPRPIGYVQPAVLNVTIVKNWGIGLLFAAPLPSQEKHVAVQIPTQIGLLKRELTKPRGPFLWAPVFQAVVMGRFRCQLVPF